MEGLSDAELGALMDELEAHGGAPPAHAAFAPPSVGLASAGASNARTAPPPPPPKRLLPPRQRPVFFASEIAALMGLHRFVSPDQALLGVLTRSHHFAPIVAAAKADMGRVSRSELLAAAAATGPALDAGTLRVAAEAAAAATSSDGIDAVVEAAQAAAAPTITSFAGDDAALAAVLAAGVASSIVRGRGVVLEEEIVDDAAEELDAEVGERNDRCWTLECRGGWAEGVRGAGDGGAPALPPPPNRRFLLLGRIDGYSAAENTLVEAKARKRALRRASDEPPQHDVIQVRAYLALLREAHPGVVGLLRETFPAEAPGGEGAVRSLRIEHDAALWALLEAQLGDVAERFMRTTPADVAALVATCMPIVAPLVRRPREPAGARAAHAHALVEGRFPFATCDLCSGRPTDGRFWSCRPCDYDECRRCYAERAGAAAGGAAAGGAAVTDANASAGGAAVADAAAEGAADAAMANATGGAVAAAPSNAAAPGASDAAVAWGGYAASATVLASLSDVPTQLASVT